MAVRFQIMAFQVITVHSVVGGYKSFGRTSLHSKSALFWDITRCRVVIVYRRFGPIFNGQKSKSFLLRLLTLEDGSNTSSRNVGKQLPHDATYYPRRAQISSTSRQKPEIKIITFM
jgi:hypothetical protein